MNGLKTYGKWLAKVGVLTVLLVGCVMGSPEEQEMLEGMEHDGPISHECFMKNNSVESVFVPSESDESTMGKTDDGRTESATKKAAVETSESDGLDSVDCQKREEFEMDGRRMEECSPSERGQGHGSPQPLDPTDPDDDDSESDGENDS